MTNIVQLEPEALAFAEATAKPPFLTDLVPEKGRAIFDELQAGSVNKLSVDFEDLKVEGSPSGHVPTRILRPCNGPATLPAIVYIHGAGWVFGNSRTHDRLIRELAVGVEAAVVFPNYSLSPEAKYPTALEESYAVVKWVAEHGIEHGMDPERLAVAGDSAGGNMTAAVTLLAKERGGPVIRQQVLFYPVTDATFDTDSYRQFAEGYYLRRDTMCWFWDQYTTNPDERNEITASLLRTSRE
jgi:acetyl esterase